MPRRTKSSICLARYFGKDQDWRRDSNSGRGIVSRFTFSGGWDTSCDGIEIVLDVESDNEDDVITLVPCPKDDEWCTLYGIFFEFEFRVGTTTS